MWTRGVQAGPGELSKVYLAAAIVAATLAAGRPAWADHKIMIEANWLDPPVVTVPVDERVTFVNRSGRAAHVEFLGDSGRHHVTQVPTEIWVIFHAPGRHPYVVHFPEARGADLRGVVEVMADPRGGAETRSCNGLTVMGACLER